MNNKKHFNWKWCNTCDCPTIICSKCGINACSASSGFVDYNGDAVDFHSVESRRNPHSGYSETHYLGYCYFCKTTGEEVFHCTQCLENYKYMDWDNIPLKYRIKLLFLPIIRIFHKPKDEIDLLFEKIKK